MAFSKDKCIGSLREAASQVDGQLGIADYRSLDISPCTATLENKFGSWNKAKEAAGLETTKHGHNPRPEGQPKPYFNYPPKPHTNNQGYEEVRVMVDGENCRTTIHRLSAVAWFGLDAVVDKHVHHKDPEGLGRPGVPWDNRESILQPMTPEEHAQHHNDMRKRDEPEERQRKLGSIA